MQRTVSSEPSVASSAALRREISARNRERCSEYAHELSERDLPLVVYSDENGQHGNFYGPSYRRILRNPGWRERLQKAYTASAKMPHRHSRTRRELDTACSSDALLMSILCGPGVLRAPRMRLLLDLHAETTLDFGIRTQLPLANDHVDRTEADAVLTGESGSPALLLEAKLTETGFQCARAALLERYHRFSDVFDRSVLPRTGRGEFTGYQLIRSILAAEHHGARFGLIIDARRTDLSEQAFRIFRAVHTSELRSRLHLYTWQELASCVPRPLRQFLGDKYGIHPA